MLPSEVAPFVKDGYETEGFVIEHDGRKVGHGFHHRAFGEVFAHGFEVESENAYAAAVLWSFARSRHRVHGDKSVRLHFEEGTPERIKAFWMRLGAVKLAEVWELGL